LPLNLKKKKINLDHMQRLDFLLGVSMSDGLEDDDRYVMVFLIDFYRVVSADDRGKAIGTWCFIFFVFPFPSIRYVSIEFLKEGSAKVDNVTF
jgi:hypothetical protein